MNVVAKLDPKSVAKFNNVLKAYTAVSKRDANEILVEQARLLVKELVKITPPFGLGNDAKRLGENAVTNDVINAVEPIKSLKVGNKQRLQDSINKYAQSGDYEKANAIIHKIKKLNKYEIVPFSPELHEDKRILGRDKLDVKPQFKITPEENKLKAYSKKVLKKVGKLKASWMPAAEKLGLKLPRWISRNADYGYKKSTVDLRSGDNPSLVIVNTATTIGRLKGYVQQAMFERAKSMVFNMRRLIKLRRQGKIA